MANQVCSVCGKPLVAAPSGPNSICSECQTSSLTERSPLSPERAPAATQDDRLEAMMPKLYAYAEEPAPSNERATSNERGPSAFLAVLIVAALVILASVIVIVWACSPLLSLR